MHNLLHGLKTRMVVLSAFTNSTCCVAPTTSIKEPCTSCKHPLHPHRDQSITSMTAPWMCSCGAALLSSRIRSWTWSVVGAEAAAGPGIHRWSSRYSTVHVPGPVSSALQTGSGLFYPRGTGTCWLWTGSAGPDSDSWTWTGTVVETWNPSRTYCHCGVRRVACRVNKRQKRNGFTV